MNMESSEATPMLQTPTGQRKTSEAISNGEGSKVSVDRRDSANGKVLHPRTPQQSNSTRTGSPYFHLQSSIHTPPAKRFQRVRNPFEGALAERLHFPMIASPSLFQRPAMSQMSSTQFEWTIDEVSSLKPAHMEPHETQFQDSPDPDYEEKVQSAISSFFKDQQIVPSPVDCPLRSQRIILAEQLNSNTPLPKSRRGIRDCGSQTELTLPAVLPKALEEALKPYLQPHLSSDDALYEFSRGGCTSEIKDISLRRKLFDMHSIIVVDNNENDAGSPKGVAAPMRGHSNLSPLHYTAIMGKLQDSDTSSFGSLSPISPRDITSISPHSTRSGESQNSDTRRKTRRRYFVNEMDDVELSPIHPPAITALKRKTLQYRCDMNTTGDNTFAELASGAIDNVAQDCTAEESFTPDRSSSPMQKRQPGFTDNSISVRVGRLMVHSTTAGNKTGKATAKHTIANIETELNETDDMLDLDEDMSHLSAQSSNCSSINSDTPRSKRRSASRKNLSHSFSNSNWLDDDNEEEMLELAPHKTHHQLVVNNAEKQPSRHMMAYSTTRLSNSLTVAEPRLAFYRTDSGFNEMTTISTSSSCVALQQDETDKQQFALATTATEEPADDTSMISCSASTPAKYDLA